MGLTLSFSYPNAGLLGLSRISYSNQHDLYLPIHSPNLPGAYEQVQVGGALSVNPVTLNGA